MSTVRRQKQTWRHDQAKLVCTILPCAKLQYLLGDEEKADVPILRYGKFHILLLRYCTYDSNFSPAIYIHCVEAEGKFPKNRNDAGLKMCYFSYLCLPLCPLTPGR